MIKEKALELFSKQYNQMQWFHSLNDSVFFKSLKKIFKLKWSYIRLHLIRQGVCKDNVIAKNFLGQKLYLPVLDGGCVNIFLFHILSRKEAPLTQFLIKNLSSKDVFYDIGASYGFYSTLAADFISEGEIHVFEPNRSVLPFLKSTISSLNREGVILDTRAIGGEEKEQIFYDYFDVANTDVNSSVSSLYKYSKDANEINTKSYLVSVITLDSYLYKNNKTKPTVLKVDIESAEYDFLVGGARFLREAKPIIILEFKLLSNEDKKNSSECLDVLNSYGYKAYSIGLSGDLVDFNKDILDYTHNNQDSFTNVVFKKSN